LDYSAKIKAKNEEKKNLDRLKKE